MYTPIDQRIFHFAALTLLLGAHAPLAHAEGKPMPARYEQQMPFTVEVFTENGRAVPLTVRRFGLIVTSKKNFIGNRPPDSADKSQRNYDMKYRVIEIDQVPLEDGSVIGYEFELPRIPRGDRLIINHRSERPYKASDGGTKWENIDAPWVYTSRDSRSVRTLFTEWRGPQTNVNVGRWRTDLVVNDRVLISRDFYLNGPAEKASSSASGSLADLTGTWAHSQADCRTAETLGNESVNISSPYEVIGICSDGFDYIYTPYVCGVTNVSRSGTALDLDASCSLRGRDPDRSHVRIGLTGADAVTFSSNGMMISGDYVRCTRSYTCLPR
jgi:hypothetical protein